MSGWKACRWRDSRKKIVRTWPKGTRTLPSGDLKGIDIGLDGWKAG